MCQDFVDKLLAAVDRSVGSKTCTKRFMRPWFDEEVKAAIRERRKIHREYRQAPSDELWERYLKERSAVRKLVRDKKAADWERLLKSLTTAHRSNLKNCWSILSRINSNAKHSELAPVMKSDGSLATSEEERLEAWAEYQEKLGSRLEDPAFDQRFATEVEAKVSELARLSPTLPASPLDGNFTKEEIKSAITRLKLGKASGADLVTNDMLKIGGDTMLKLLSRLFQWLNEAEVVPEQWCHAIVTNIFKKGDPADPSNYRGISLISCLGKTYLSIWAARLTTHMESQLSEDQGGFCPGRSTIDQIFTLHETLKERREQKKESYLFFGWR